MDSILAVHGIAARTSQASSLPSRGITRTASSCCAMVPSSPTASAQTSRSSLTMRVEEDVVPVFVSPELQREITRQEARIEQYGGDDVEPPQHEKVQPPAEDPNRVAWDGPDDQLNPQNWTETRRWLITLVCEAPMPSGDMVNQASESGPSKA